MRSVSRVRETLLQGCPGHCCCHCTGRAPPPVETVQASLGPPVGTETHTTHPSGPGALTSVHWTRGHVSRGQPVSKFASQRTKKLLNSHCERYLKHCPLRSEFYLAAVGWLTLTRRSSLPSRHNCHRHHCGVRVIPALTVSKWQCSSFSKQIVQRLLTFEAYQGSNLSRVQLKIWRYIIQIKLLSVNSRWRCRSQVENLNDKETLKLTNFLPWTPTSEVRTRVIWWTTTGTSPTSRSTRPRSSASAKMPGYFPTCRLVQSTYFSVSHSIPVIVTVIQISYIYIVSQGASKPFTLCIWVTQVCPWTFRKAIRPLLNSTLCFADTNSGVRVNWGLEKITCSVTVRGDAASIFTMKLFVSNVRTHNRCELLCCLIMTNKLNVLMSSEHCLLEKHEIIQTLRCHKKCEVTTYVWYVQSKPLLYYLYSFNQTWLLS